MEWGGGGGGGGGHLHGHAKALVQSAHAAALVALRQTVHQPCTVRTRQESQAPNTLCGRRAGPLPPPRCHTMRRAVLDAQQYVRSCAPCRFICDSVSTGWWGGDRTLYVAYVARSRDITSSWRKAVQHLRTRGRPFPCPHPPPAASAQSPEGSCVHGSELSCIAGPKCSCSTPAHACRYFSLSFHYTAVRQLPSQHLVCTTQKFL